MKERNKKRGMNEWEENTCPRCKGTGMVCGHKPEILPGACCADFANAVCPECGGTGKDPRKRGKTKASPQ
jgi:DnaJ-class molecular chaperone